MLKACTKFFSFYLFYLILVVDSCLSHELPEGYKHASYAEQIHQYRKIYASIDHNKPNFSTIHVKGLFDILKNGFALATDFIKKNSQKGAHQDIALTDLKRFFNLANNLESHEQLNQKVFLAIHLFMASIVDRFKEVPQERDKILELFNKKELEIVLSSNDPTRIAQKANFVHGKPGTPPVAIIYRGRMGISPTTFVSQFFDESYPVALALFDITIAPFVTDLNKPNQTGSKKDPHYSKFNSTTKLLYHDLSHVREQAEKEDYLFQFYQTPIMD